ncbi:MAG: hypothetical protein FJ087_00765 [Deltaproteobacteria bacterium]|nr:hypothetical protein [Deltaproteobacteria bacterium]
MLVRLVRGRADLDDRPCLLDPSDGLHKECHHVTTDGRCVHYGAWCDPRRPLRRQAMPSCSCPPRVV